MRELEVFINQVHSKRFSKDVKLGKIVTFKVEQEEWEPDLFHCFLGNIRYDIYKLEGFTMDEAMDYFQEEVANDLITHAD